jgi:hypothetical protein
VVIGAKYQFAAGIPHQLMRRTRRACLRGLEERAAAWAVVRTRLVAFAGWPVASAAEPPPTAVIVSAAATAAAALWRPDQGFMAPDPFRHHGADPRARVQVTGRMYDS